jgi:hypothetical protein
MTIGHVIVILCHRFLVIGRRASRRGMQPIGTLRGKPRPPTRTFRRGAPAAAGAPRRKVRVVRQSEGGREHWRADATATPSNLRLLTASFVVVAASRSRHLSALLASEERETPVCERHDQYHNCAESSDEDSQID